MVSIYGGYFGAGIGILMLATLGFVGMHDIYEMNTLKTILGSLINLVAAVWFIRAGLIDWPRAAVMTVGAVADIIWARIIPSAFHRPESGRSSRPSASSSPG